MNIFQVKSFIRYLILSRHRKGHGIHSPFVFDLVSRVFRNKISRDVVCSIETVRKRLQRNYTTINVNDFGAGGSRKKNRKVSEIAHNSAIPKKYGILLSNLAFEYGRGTILELGTSLGISAMYMAAGNDDSIVYTIDGCSECHAIASENYIQTGILNIQNITGSFDSVLPDVVGTSIKPGFIFIDGDHRKEALLRNFSLIAENAGSETVIAIDDIYHSREMNEAWNEICNDENVSFTIDVFRMGIVFFRKGMTRNSYIIRY